MTTRGFDTDDFDYTAELFDTGIKLAAKIDKETNFATLREFKQFVNTNWEYIDELVALKKKVNAFVE